MSSNRPESHQVAHERFALLRTLETMLAGPLSVMGLVWLALIIVGFVWGYTPWLQDLSLAVWAVFVLDFIVRLLIAPKRLQFLKQNLLIALTLLLPALSLLRVIRIFALLPSSQMALLQLLSGINRSLRVLQGTMERRGLGYVLAITAIVLFAGAAGMYRFEHDAGRGAAMNTYGYAVWWTAMILTTLGSDYFPHTQAGRVLCFLLSVFAFSIFGYITAAVSSFFINKDAEDKNSPVPNAQQLETILAEVRGLRKELEALQSSN